jgi:hypothetical protein
MGVAKGESRYKRNAKWARNEQPNFGIQSKPLSSFNLSRILYVRYSGSGHIITGSSKPRPPVHSNGMGSNQAGKHADGVH